MKTRMSHYSALPTLLGILLFGFACDQPTDDDSSPAAGDASLSALVVVDGASGQDLVLDPVFAPDTVAYSATASVMGSVLTVQGSTTATIFIVNINGATADYLNNNDFESPAALNLTAPETITISVTAEDNTVLQYVVDIAAP